MTIEVVAGRAARRGEDDRHAALQVEAEDRRVAEAEVDEQQHDGDDDDAEQRGPAGGDASFDVSSARRRRNVVVVVGRFGSVGLASAVGRRRSAAARVDLALDRARAMRICTSSSISSQTRVALEAGDEPVDAGGRDHLVADLERRLQRLLLAHAGARCGRIMRKYIASGISRRIPSWMSGAAAAESSSAARMREDVHRVPIRSEAVGRPRTGARS